METLDRLQSVYAKWERPMKNGHPSQSGQNYAQHYNAAVSSGQRAWHEKFANSNMPAPRQMNYRSRNRHRNDRNAVVDLPINTQLSNLAFFKWKPTILPQSEQFRRVFMGRCCSCMPNSKNEFFEDHVEGQGLCNILDVNTKRGKGIQSFFYHMSFTLMRDQSHRYPRVNMKVLCNPKVVQAIQMTAQAAADEEGKGDDEAYVQKLVNIESKRAKSLVRRLTANFSNVIIRIVGFVLHKTLSYLYGTIIVHKGEMAMLKQAVETGIPVIYLPTHRSHMDYILMTFTLWNFDIRAPHVAAGDNLLIPFFGFLMRRLGGFFIRRRMDQKNGKKDLTYRAILNAYMQEILMRGETVEFFLEAGRSRSGKVLPPKSGLLSLIVEAYLEGHIPDAYLVPVSFSYEKLLEGSFSSELMGEQKKAESFWSVVSATWQVIRTHFGNVRIEFAQPFSLKEYLQVSQSYFHSYDQQSQWEMCGSPLPISCKFDSNSSLFGLEEHRHTIQSLAQHVLYNCMNIQAVMSTHLVAFLLLTKHREGVDIDVFEESMTWLRQELTTRRRDVGFCGKSRDVILHAVELLGPELVKVSHKNKSSEDKNNNTNDSIILTPNLTLPKLFDLIYYSNVIVPIFAVEATVAAAVCSLAGDQIWLPDSESPPTITRSALLQRAIDICHILQFEFIFKPPCATWMQIFTDAIDQLVIYEILVTVEEQESMWTRRLSRRMRVNEDSDEEEVDEDIVYDVKLTEEISRERMKFLVNVLSPLVECYHIVVCQASSLKDSPQPEKEFIRKVHGHLKQRVTDNVTAFPESASSDTLRNAVRSLQQIHVLESLEEGTTSMIRMVPSSESEARLGQVLDILDACRVSEMV